LPTSVSASGVIRGGQAVCYLSTEDASKIKAGQTVAVQAVEQNGTFNGKVSDVGMTPLSSSEVAAELGSDYLTSILATTKYSVRTVIAVPQTGIADGTVLNLKIIVEEKRPFDFLGG
ncbi:MAG TPA: hypothetical protein VHR42_04480, partial [Clostridia bacterium]|nr:hypothetical protein [Clostridia bacterium]